MGTKNRSSGSQINPRGAAQGITLVAHESGLPIDSKVDNQGVRRLAVDSTATIENANITVDLDSESGDSVAIGNTGNSDKLYVHTDGSITIRLKDESGQPFSVANPLPVQIVAASGLDVNVRATGGDTVALSGHTSQIFEEGEVDITTDTWENVLTFVASSAGTNISFAEITGVVNAVVRMTLNGTTIRKKHIHHGCPNVEFPFPEPRTIGSGDTIRIDAKPDKTPPAFLSGANFFASLQGFVE